MIMNFSTDDMISLARLALLFGRVNRVTFHEDGVTPESDTDHTVMLGLIACSVARELEVYNVSRVAELTLVHDIVEAGGAGDTNTFDISARDREAKKVREAKAKERLEREFGEDSWLIRTLHAYEAQEEPEARLVRFLDKAMPKINHMLNRCASIKKMGKTRDDLVRAHQEQLAELIQEYPDVSKHVGLLLTEIMLRSEEAW